MSPGKNKDEYLRLEEGSEESEIDIPCAFLFVFYFGFLLILTGFGLFATVFDPFLVYNQGDSGWIGLLLQLVGFIACWLAVPNHTVRLIGIGYIVTVNVLIIVLQSVKYGREF